MTYYLKFGIARRRLLLNLLLSTYAFFFFLRIFFYRNDTLNRRGHRRSNFVVLDLGLARCHTLHDFYLPTFREPAQ